jgi:guanylate kinase
MNRGALFVVSAPSGAGKTTLIRRVMDRMDGLRFSVSHTTRPHRGGEREAEDYFFVSEGEFQAMIREDRFLEWARVHENFYGTSRAWVEERMQRGEDVVLDIDVQGASQVKERVPESVHVLVFPPSYEVLRTRLISRGSDRVEAVERRLLNARAELDRFPMYDYVIINEEIGTAVNDLVSILQARRLQASRLEDRIRHILSTFP